ncbi:MAG: YfcE family phosphodiesterase [Phycisphaerae bacterium]|nr:YfcE family phosphodiesterase [Phycisphaerae bacterium]MDP7636464.1 YfcE family phosphodiesterase [Phycisphaerae bacterium]
MRIGLLSDSHGRTGLLRAAMAALATHDVEVLVHCGDIHSPGDVEVLGAAGTPAYLVAGNSDHQVDRLAEAAERCGVHFSPLLIDVPLRNEQYLAALHGHDLRLLKALVAAHRFPYICHGHTHRTSDDRHGKVRVICPGALHHPRRSKHPTAAVLDTHQDTVTFIDTTEDAD